MVADAKTRVIVAFLTLPQREFEDKAYPRIRIGGSVAKDSGADLWEVRA